MAAKKSSTSRKKALKIFLSDKFKKRERFIFNINIFAAKAISWMKRMKNSLMREKLLEIFMFIVLNCLKK